MLKSLTENEKPEKRNPGPVLEKLEFEPPAWEQAVSKALHKKRPKEGWPKAKSEAAK